MRIKLLHDAERGQTWAVRLVEQGDHYGLHDQLQHEDTAPLVEFFDPRHPETDLGQFVSRYNAETLLDRPATEGLCLDGGTPTWAVSGTLMGRLTHWLRQQTAVIA